MLNDVQKWASSKEQSCCGDVMLSLMYCGNRGDSSRWQCWGEADALVFGGNGMVCNRRAL